MKKAVTVLIFISFLFYMLNLFGLLFFKAGWSDPEMSIWEYIQYSTNLIPFRTITTYFKALFDGSMNIEIPVMNLFGNLLLFLPMGFYLPYYLNKLKRLTPYLCLVAIIILTVEVLQTVTRRGSFDIDDFILNFIGAVIGFVICKYTIISRIFKFAQNKGLTPDK